ncbi:MAG: hypothetical protein OJF62_002188 [Pseudolabrys sp.]|jgi:hypothetical protein|nr:hypothetical protein [Pseudolabrys sp.]
MHHVVFFPGIALWTAVSIVLWSQKQEQVTLFLESLGLGAVAFAAMYWYATRPAK